MLTISEFLEDLFKIPLDYLAPAGPPWPPVPKVLLYLLKGQLWKPGNPGNSVSKLSNPGNPEDLIEIPFDLLIDEWPQGATET